MNGGQSKALFSAEIITVSLRLESDVNVCVLGLCGARKRSLWLSVRRLKEKLYATNSEWNTKIEK